MRCFRPYGSGRKCLCPFIREVDTGVKFVFLMHPKEAKHERTGTGQLAHISLVDSQLFIGLEFGGCAPFQTLLNDGRYYSVLLYPSDKDHLAMTAQSKELKASLAGSEGEIPNKKLLVVLLDATWFCSRKLIEHNQFLLQLPRISFSGSYRSEYRFKREPRPGFISTIEACYYLVKELQQAGLVNASTNIEPLMAVFRRMVQNQIDAQNERIAGLRPNSHAYDWKYTAAFKG